MVNERSITLNTEAACSSEALALTSQNSEDHNMNIYYFAQSSPGSASNNAPNTIMSEESTHWMDVPPDYPFHFFSLIQKKTLDYTG